MNYRANFAADIWVRDLTEREKQSKLARKMLKDTKDLRDFGYQGELDLCRPSNPEGLWGFTSISVHRDSDVLARSNWEVVSEDLLKRFPETCEIVSTSHWAVGWLDHLAIQWTASNGTITLVGQATLEWFQKLEDYPVADEDHYSQLESDENYDTMIESIRAESHSFDLIEDLPKNWKDQILDWIQENDSRGWDTAWDREGWLDVDPILDALAAKGWLDYSQPF